MQKKHYTDSQRFVLSKGPYERRTMTCDFLFVICLASPFLSDHINVLMQFLRIESCLKVLTSQICVLLQPKDGIRAVGLAATSVEYPPGKVGSLWSQRCWLHLFLSVLLSWSLSRHLSCVLTVALSCEEGIIKQLIKEGHIISQVKGTQMYCQEPGREMVGLGPLLGGLSIMRVRQLCMIIFLLCNRCDLYRFFISENLNTEVLHPNFFFVSFPLLSSSLPLFPVLAQASSKLSFLL